MEPFTSRRGPWIVTHLPAGSSAYDKVIGRMTAWSLIVEHDTGWRIVEVEGDPEARVITPGGLLVAVLAPEAGPGDARGPLPPLRSDVLAAALTEWVHQHAEEYEEPDIPD